MGCINSKVINGSMSIMDVDLNNHNSLSISSHLSWEELLITSQSGTDQLIALVCLTTNKLRISNATDNPDITRCAGSRIFHTVEEYDALLENIRKFSTRIIRHFDNEDNNSEAETAGWRRKVVAMGLKPLEVSTTIEFSDNWQGDEMGHVDSPRMYVTLKFGNYNKIKRGSCRIRREKEEESVFSRELVTAFEDCMKQLRDDDASILWEMDVRSVSENHGD